MTAPYAVRAIDIDLQLDKALGGGDPISLRGHRVHVVMQHALMPAVGANAFVHIYGMTLDHMNELTKAGLMWGLNQINKIRISAGDSISGMTKIFDGTILEAYPDFRKQPDTPFFIRANPGILAQLKPVKPLSYPQSVDVATAMQTMAESAGFKLENNGVNIKLSASYFYGTAWNQILQITRAANIFGSIDSVNKVIAIWPKTGKRSGDKVLIAPETGMIGYPMFQASRVNVRVLFDPDLKALPAGPGKVITIKSDLKGANGDFNINNIDYDLWSQQPGGSWEMVITASPDGYGRGGGT